MLENQILKRSNKLNSYSRGDDVFNIYSFALMNNVIANSLFGLRCRLKAYFTTRERKMTIDLEIALLLKLVLIKVLLEKFLVPVSKDIHCFLELKRKTLKSCKWLNANKDMKDDMTNDLLSFFNNSQKAFGIRNLLPNQISGI